MGQHNFLKILVCFLIVLPFLSAFSGSGFGNSTIPFQITNCTQLQEVNNNLTAYYVLANDVDCNDTTTWNGGNGFNPIANGSTFWGNFDGQNFNISNLYIAYSTSGLFETTSGEISNVHIEDINITGGSVGGLAWWNNGTIIGCSVKVKNITGIDVIGGLVGNNRGNISNSYVYGDTILVIGGSGVNIGGLVGYDYGGIIRNCSSVNNLVSTSAGLNQAHYSGGLIGVSTLTQINTSFSTGNISARVNCGPIGNCNLGSGGLIGDGNAIKIWNSYARGQASIGKIGATNPSIAYVGGFGGRMVQSNITNSYSTGKVICGIVGSSCMGFATSGTFGYQNPSTFKNCLYDYNTSGGYSDNFPGVVIEYTPQMKDIRAFTFINWIQKGSYNLTSPVYDFLGNQYNDTQTKNIWNINPLINEGYPYLYLYDFIVDLNSPLNGTSSNGYTTFSCTGTSQSNLTNSTLEIWNSTSGSLYYSETKSVTGLTNTTTFNYTFLDEGSFFWNCLFADDGSNFIESEANRTIYLSLIAPAVSLFNPEENFYFNYSDNILFNFTAIDTDGLSVCELWSNFTGNWDKNYTWNSPLSGNSTTTNVNIPNGFYLWNVWCNDTSNNGGFHENNHTFIVDTIFPIGYNISITTTPNSQTFLFLTNISDINLGVCKYSIKDLNGSINGANENLTFICNQLASASTFGFGTFYLVIDAEDKAGNSIQQNQTFTTSFTPGGGPGSGSSGSPILSTGNWTMETEFGGSKYQFNMIQGSSRTKNILFENLGTTARTITMSCEFVSGDKDLCEGIEFEDKTFSLPLVKGIKTSDSFTLTIPKDYAKGKYVINLIATDEERNVGIITTEIDISSSSSVVGIITKLFSKTQRGIPYFLFFLLVAILTGVFANFVIFKPSKIPGGFSVIVGIIMGFVFLLLPI